MKGDKKPKHKSSLKESDGSLQAAIGALIFFVAVVLGFLFLSFWAEYPRR